MGHGSTDAFAIRVYDTYGVVWKSINPYTPGKYASLVDVECSCELCSRVADRFVTLLREGLHAREYHGNRLQGERGRERESENVIDIASDV